MILADFANRRSFSVTSPLYIRSISFIMSCVAKTTVAFFVCVKPANVPG